MYGLKEYQNNEKHQQVTEDDEISLIGYFFVLFKYRRMILWICGIAVVIAAIVSLSLPKTYSATTTIVPPMDIIQKSAELGGGLGGVKSSFISKAIGVTNIADMYVGILNSRAVVDAIIDKFDLMKVYGEKTFRSDIRERLQNNTKIKVSDDGIIRIAVEDRSPDRAAAIANAYVEELDQQNKRLSAGQATSKKEFLENRLKEIEKKLSEIDNILSREAKIQEMLFELLTRECEVAKIEEAKSMPTIQVLDKADVPEKKCKPNRRQMVMVSAMVSFIIAVIAAFGCEYFAKIKRIGVGLQQGLSFKSTPQRKGASNLRDLESKRKIVAEQRMRAHEGFSEKVG